MNWIFCLTLAAAIVAGGSSRADDEDGAGGSTALTIYSTASPGAIPADLYRPLPSGGSYGNQGRIPGYAVVKDERPLMLDVGRGLVRFTDVAALIEPTTVSFRSLTDPEGTRVLEQNFQFDLVSGQKLLERYLDREITVEQARGDTVESFTGTLLSAAGGLILQDRDGTLRTLSGYTNIRFPELPGGLMTRPTLVWDVVSHRGGEQRARVTYQTGGVTWWADYNLIFSEGKDANSGVLDVGSWVSILNRSGAGYEDAKLKLIAGDVHRAPQQPVGRGRMDYMAKAEAVSAPGFEEKAFFEYHLYTLGRPTTLPDNSTKQIELFDAARGVQANKLLVYYGLSSGYRGFYPNPMTDRGFGVQSNPKVDIYLEFDNSKENGLGIPLPSGRVRVSQIDPADDTLEFIGEDVIDHTPKDEEVLIKLGSAFDVVGERKQVDFKVDTARKWMDEAIEVRIRNHKDQPVTVLVKETLYRWVNWDVVSASHTYDKKDARTIQFPVRVEPDGEQVIRYRVHYSW